MFGVSFLAPLFLAGAVAVAIPIALHLFHRRADPVIEFAAMRYLRQAPVQQSSRRRVRDWLLLALRVAALLVMALAFARPYVAASGMALADGATVVLVDTSASMTAPGQFDRARTRASEIIRRVPLTHAVAVIGFSQAADVVAPLATDRAVALSALSRLQPGAGATRYRTAVKRAIEELGGRAGRLVVVTDLQATGWDAGTQVDIPGNVALDVEPIAAPMANVALTSLRVQSTDAIATVKNYGSEPAAAQVVFASAEHRIGAVPVNLPASGTAEAHLALPGQAAGSLVATVTDAAGYSADNARYAVVDGDTGVLVLAVTASGNPSDALYFERALAIAGGAGGFRFRSVPAATLGTLNQATMAAADVIALLGSRGLDQQGRQKLVEFLDGGGGLLVAAGPDVQPDVLTQGRTAIAGMDWSVRDSGAVSLAPADSRHPIFRLFGGAGALANVTFTRVAVMDEPVSAKVLARYTDGTPAVLEESHGRGRVVVFASDLNNRWNNFPLRPAFVPFIHETVRYLASARAESTDYVVGEIPAATAPGIIHLSKAVAAVNVDTRESDPAAFTPEAFRSGFAHGDSAATQPQRVAERQQEDSQGLWRYGLLLMLTVLVSEGLLGRRAG